MSNKYIAGPWVALPHDENAGYDCMSGGVNIETPDGQRIVTVDEADFYDEPDRKEIVIELANLIAAAPELLAALRDTLDWLDDGNRQLSDSCAADVAKARAAIAKATGSEA